MRAINLQQIVQATAAKILVQGPSEFTGIGTDTRLDLRGQLFIALAGESFDAHDFLKKAVEQKAAAILLHKNAELLSDVQGVTVLQVPDTLKALQDLGHWARQQSQAQIIGITGSNGKTTSKEFAATIIGASRSVHYNKGSFNNHWGVPMTLLQLDPRKQIALVEMGMNHAGEITRLVEIAQPDIVVCTMVGRAHIEHFGTIENIAKAKQEIYLASQPGAQAVFNLDNPFTAQMYKESQARRRWTFSCTDKSADVFLKIKSMNMRSLEVEGTIQGEKGQVTVAVFGAQNLTNLMAAVGIGLAAGLSPAELWRGLALCKTNWGRNQLIHLKCGAEMIFDAYNANPDSMRALLDNVSLLNNEGKKIGVFGEMLEMGPQAPQLHFELGEWVGRSGFDKVYFTGEHFKDFAQGLSAAQFKKDSVVEKEFASEMATNLAAEIQQQDIVVVKGSRGMKLERFVLPCEPLDFDLKKD